MSHPIPPGKQAHYKRAWHRLASKSAALGWEYHRLSLSGADPSCHLMAELYTKLSLTTRAEQRLASRFQAGRP